MSSFRTTYDYDCIFCVQTVTEITVAVVVETTGAATVTESTVAAVVETTASDVEDDNIDDQNDGDRPDCAGEKEFIDRAQQGL